MKMKGFHEIPYRLRNPHIRTHWAENMRLWSRGDFNLINSPCRLRRRQRVNRGLLMSAADVTDLKASYRNYRPVIDTGFCKFWLISWISIFRPTPVQVLLNLTNPRLPLLTAYATTASQLCLVVISLCLLVQLLHSVDGFVPSVNSAMLLDVSHVKLCRQCNACDVVIGPQRRPAALVWLLTALDRVGLHQYFASTTN